eukprot:gnl/TRDRNA2_/TRDRNA2_135072_c0_seq1.p1 gnl/TRDRNA2_/TRDRNA2_135072_c0~~gnl/TRDRNA2_/TRDRNA2_135072_c0_seq1.p1  ORF type:complete len:987 (+),score=62.04 gnl/TRDRNA2_/TRDRNA2_135072_c0_seq1:82-3042(+)
MLLCSSRPLLWILLATGLATILLMASILAWPPSAAALTAQATGNATMGNPGVSDSDDSPKPCDAGYHLMFDSCLANMCRCAEGEGAFFTGCDVHDREVCVTCKAGFHLDRETCLPNICRCNRGEAATGTKCAVHDSEVCGKCSAGFHLDSETGRCAFNVCLCHNGTAVAGCSEHGAEATCTSCNAGYHLDSGKCSPNVCACSNGTGAVGSACANDNGAYCKSCDAGYHLVLGSCLANSCTCIDGEAATGPDCVVHNSETCASCIAKYKATCTDLKATVCTAQSLVTCSSCHVNYTLSSDQCVACIAPAEGSSHSVCSRCPTGYLYSGPPDTCIPNECTCKNGQAAVGSACTEHKAEICALCDAGHSPECSNGIVDAFKCSGADSCISCNRGWHLQDGKCLVNQCVCLNGVASTGDDCITYPFPHGKCCAVHKGYACVSCDIGYSSSLDANQWPKWTQCETNHCKCTNGEPTQGPACPNPAEETCAYCHTGYHNRSGKCERNVCTCRGGTQAVGLACTRHGAKMCAPTFSVKALTDEGSTTHLCNSSGSAGACREFVRHFLAESANIAVWTPEAKLTEPCSAQPLRVPYVVCFRGVLPQAMCPWSGMASDSGSSIRVKAVGMHAVFTAKLEDYHVYFANASPRRANGTLAECQRGLVELRDVDRYTINATLLHSGCDWARRGNISRAAATTSVEVVAGHCSSSLSLPLCSDTGMMSSAARAPGRWVARDSAASGPWAHRIFNRGQDCIQDRGPPYTDRHCWEIHKCGRYERVLHDPMVWMPWGCQMLPTREVSDCFKYVAQNVSQRNGKGDVIYMIGESHNREMARQIIFRFHGNKYVLEWNNVCDPLPATPDAAVIVVAGANWEGAFPSRRPLSDTSLCLQAAMAELAKRQAKGVVVRMGTPVAYCCRMGHSDQFHYRAWTRKNVALIAEAVREAAEKHGVPLWDLWSITNGWEEDTVTDGCNHWNTEMYHVGLQVLCNSMPGGIL